jgi:hypothetical protein
MSLSSSDGIRDGDNGADFSSGGVVHAAQAHRATIVSYIAANLSCGKNDRQEIVWDPYKRSIPNARISRW